MAKMRWYDWIAYILIVIGAINWGIQGTSRLITNKSFDLVTVAFQSNPTLGYLVLILVGIAGVYAIFTAFKIAHK